MAALVCLRGLALNDVASVPVPPASEAACYFAFFAAISSCSILRTRLGAKELNYGPLRHPPSLRLRRRGGYGGQRFHGFHGLRILRQRPRRERFQQRANEGGSTELAEVNEEEFPLRFVPFCSREIRAISRIGIGMVKSLRNGVMVAGFAVDMKAGVADNRKERFFMGKGRGDVREWLSGE